MSSSIGKNSSMGSSGKSSNLMGSGGKSGKLLGSSSGSGYSAKSSSPSFMGASTKSDSLLGSSGKSSTIMPSAKSYESSAKSNSGATSGKTGSFLGYSAKSECSTGSSSKTTSLGYSGKTGSFYGYSAKPDNTATSGKSKVPSPTEKSNFLLPSAKSNSGLGMSDKNKTSSAFKSSPDSSREYPTFVNPLGNKSKTRIGIIWIPTKKRNKKKDMVFNSHNYERYKEKGPSMYSYMSGDSHSYQQPPKKKEEETDLLVPERPKLTTVAVNTGITAASIDLATDDPASGKPEEKQEFIKRDSEETKEAAGDTNEKNNRNDSDYLENKDNDAKSQDSKWDKNKQGDKVDSVYLRPPPPHKTRSAASTNDDEDCGIKCLYYTLQCCDCVLM